MSSLLLQDTNSDDYVEGLFAASFLIAIFIIVWFVMLVVFGCLGPNRVGWLSGKLFKPPYNKNNNNNNNNRNEEEDIYLPPAQVYNNTPSTKEVNKTVSVFHARQKRSLLLTRIVVLFCTVGIIVCSLLMVIKGVQSLDQASNDMIRGIDEGIRLSEDGIALVDQFSDLTMATSTTTTNFAQNLNGACPLVRSQICTNLNSTIGSQLPVECDFSGLPYQNEFEQLLNLPSSFITNELDSVRNDLEETVTMLNDAKESAGNLNWVFAIAMMFAMALMVLCIIISFGVVEAWCGFTKNRNCLFKLLACLRHWIILPLFIFLVIVSWALSMVFIIGSTASADLCVDSPDQRLEAVLVKYGDWDDSTDTVILDFLLFYIRGCPAGTSPNPYLEQISSVTDTLSTVHTFLDDIAIDASFDVVCGSDSLRLAASGVTVAFQQTLCDFGKALVDLQTFFTCANWRPLYRAVMYDAVCYNSNEGFYYLAICQFCIVIFAMIMVTLRVAFAEIESDSLVAPVNDDLDGAAAAMGSSDMPPTQTFTKNSFNNDYEDKSVGSLYIDQ